MKTNFNRVIATVATWTLGPIFLFIGIIMTFFFLPVVLGVLIVAPLFLPLTAAWKWYEARYIETPEYAEKPVLLFPAEKADEWNIVEWVENTDAATNKPAAPRQEAEPPPERNKETENYQFGA